MSLFDSASLVVTPNGVKAGKLYSIKPTDGSGDLSVTRATSATRVNSNELIESVASNVPRLDYSNGSCPSILVEPQRTNLALRSEEFDNASWTKTNANISANSIISPDGTQNADKFIATSISTVHLIRQTTTSGAYAFSIYAKAGEEDVFSMWVANATKRAQFNLTYGTIETSTVLHSSIDDVGNGWYRCTVYDSSPSTTYTIYGRNGGSYLGNDSDGFYIWGAQLEAGVNATSYIPTVASTVTRNADVISKTGISDLIGQTEGTMFVEIAPLTIENASRDIEISDGNNNRVIIQFNAIGIGAFVIVGGVIQASLSFNNLDTNFKKVALKYKVNDFSLFVDGVKVAFDTSGTTFPLNTLTRLDFKKVTPSSLEYYGKVKSLCLWKTALTEQECIELTTI